MKEVNSAFLQKLGWNILRKLETHWVRILKAKYFPQNSFLDLESTSGSSLVWQGISKVKAALRANLFFIPKNGWKLDISRDPRIPNHSGFSPTWRFDATPSSKIHRVAELVEEATGEWNTTLLHSLYSADTVNHFLELSLPNRQISEAIIWTSDPKGTVTMKGVVFATQEQHCTSW